MLRVVTVCSVMKHIYTIFCKLVGINKLTLSTWFIKKPYSTWNHNQSLPLELVCVSYIYILKDSAVKNQISVQCLCNVLQKVFYDIENWVKGWELAYSIATSFADLVWGFDLWVTSFRYRMTWKHFVCKQLNCNFVNVLNYLYIQCPPQLLAPLVNVTKTGYEKIYLCCLSSWSFTQNIHKNRTFSLK